MYAFSSMWKLLLEVPLHDCRRGSPVPFLTLRRAPNFLLVGVINCILKVLWLKYLASRALKQNLLFSREDTVDTKTAPTRTSLDHILKLHRLMRMWSSLWPQRAKNIKLHRTRTKPWCLLHQSRSHTVMLRKICALTKSPRWLNLELSSVQWRWYVFSKRIYSSDEHSRREQSRFYKVSLALYRTML